MKDYGKEKGYFGEKEEGYESTNKPVKVSNYPGYSSTLDISELSKRKYRLINSGHDFLTTVAKYCGEIVGGPGGEYIAEKVGDISKEYGEQYTDVHSFIGEDVEDNINGFYESDTFELQMKHLVQLNMGMSVVRDDDYGVKYEIDYLKAGVELMVPVFRDLHSTDEKLAAKIKKVNLQMGKLQEHVRTLETTGGIDRESLGKQVKQVLENVDDLKRHFNRELSVQLENVEANINAHQQESLNHYLSQFGLKLDRELVRVDNNYRVMMGQVSKVLDHFEIEVKQQAIQAKFSGAEQACGAIAAIGQMFGSRDIARIGVIGQSAVKIALSVGQLTGSFGLLQVAGLAALGPMSAIIFAGLSVFSCFSSGPSELQQIAKAIRAMHQEMRSSFNQVMRNQEMIYKTLIHGLEYLVKDVKMPILDELNSIEGELLQSQAIAGEERQQILLHELRNLLVKTQSCLADELDTGTQRRLSKYKGQLANWITNESRLGMYTGALHLKNFGVKDRLNNIGRVLTIKKSSNVVTMLAMLAKELDSKFPKSINIGLLFNINIWMTAMPTYIRINESLKSTSMHTESMSTIQKMSKNMFAFLQYLQSDPNLYHMLQKKHKESYQTVEHLLNEKYDIYRKSIDNRSGPDRTLEMLLASKDGIDIEIGCALNHLDAYAKLMRAYASLNGLSMIGYEFQLQDKPAVTKSIMRWGDKSFSDPKFNDEAPDNLRTVGQSMCYAKLNIGGESRLYMVQLTKEKKLQLNFYNVEKNSWEQVFEEDIEDDVDLGKNYPMHAIAKTYNGKEQLVIMVNHHSYLSFHRYDPQSQKPWVKLPSIDKFKQKQSKNAARLTNLMVKDIDRVCVVTCGSGFQLELMYLDESGDKEKWCVGGIAGWGSRCRKPVGAFGHHPELIICDEATENFSIQVMRKDQKDTLFALVFSVKGRLLYKYDTEQHAWSACATGELSLGHVGYMGNMQFYSMFSTPGCKKEYYLTLNDNLVKVDDKHYIVSSIRTKNGMCLIRYDIDNNVWEKLPDEGAPKWSDASGYANWKFYGGMRTEVVNIDGRDNLVVSMRNAKNVQIARYDFNKIRWFMLQPGPDWSDSEKYDQVDSVATTQLLVLPVKEGSDELMLVCRHNSGLQGMRLQCQHPLHHLPILQPSSLINGSLFEQLAQNEEAESFEKNETNNM